MQVTAMTAGLDRRRFLTLSATATALAALPRFAHAAAGEVAPLPKFSAPPADAHWPGYAGALVIDGLGGPGGSDEAGEAGEDGLLSAADLADAKASGITAANLTVSSVGRLAGAFEDTVKKIATWERNLDRHPEALLRIRTAADLRTAKTSGRLGLIYGFQDTLPLGEDLDRIALFHGLGVRIIQMTYNRRNLAGDGCLEPADAGLSLLGREMIARMNAAGILVDLGHGGRRTTLDTIAASKKPVAISHTGCAALADLPRNKTDDELRRLAEKGGVAGIYLMPFLRTEGQPMAEDVVRHIEHAVQVCGEDHVGIGTDGPVSPVHLTPEYVKSVRDDVEDRRRRGISAPGERPDVYPFVPDLNTPKRFELIAWHLSRRGHSAERIGKILGGNFARLFHEVWGD
ncbi:MAG TPA: membrane dipeptidase [Thermoanaerobaculia bacterium]|nr:membrane dipeptidase [Thermoanaerobaculia bacterium]